MFLPTGLVFSIRVMKKLTKCLNIGMLGCLWRSGFAVFGAVGVFSGAVFFCFSAFFVGFGIAVGRFGIYPFDRLYALKPKNPV